MFHGLQNATRAAENHDRLLMASEARKSPTNASPGMNPAAIPEGAPCDTANSITIKRCMKDSSTLVDIHQSSTTTPSGHAD